MKNFLLILFAICAFTRVSIAQKDSTKHCKIVRNGRFYASWGYNTEWYTHSNITVNQPGDGNNYTFENLTAHDHIGWDQLFQVAPSIPQYNYRLGYFFNAKQTWGFELNFDHTKYVISQGNLAIIKGTLGGRPNIDTAVYITNATLRYQLNNGANWFLFNVVRRFFIYTGKNNNFEVAALVKAGVGPVIPHVDDAIMGHQNNPHFQIGGVNAGLEGTIRFTFFGCAYLEYCNKVDFADYWGLRVYDGTARQSFGAYEMIANIGVTFHLHRSAGTGTAF